MLWMANKISEHPSHVLNSEFVLLPSRKRYRLPLCKLVRYKYEFVPHALTLMNKMKEDIKGMGMDSLILEMCNSEK